MPAHKTYYPDVFVINDQDVKKMFTKKKDVKKIFGSKCRYYRTWKILCGEKKK